MKLHDGNRRDDLPVFLAPNNLHVLVLTPEQLEMVSTAVSGQFEAADEDANAGGTEDEEERDAWSELLDVVDGKDAGHFVVPAHNEGSLTEWLLSYACNTEPTWAAWVAGKA